MEDLKWRRSLGQSLDLSKSSIIIIFFSSHYMTNYKTIHMYNLNKSWHVKKDYITKITNEWSFQLSRDKLEQDNFNPL